MTTIYIVQIEGGNFECNWTDPIKAFFNKEDAETFKTEIELKQLEFEEKKKALQDEFKDSSFQERLDGKFGERMSSLMVEYKETPFPSSAYEGIYIEEMEVF